MNSAVFKLNVVVFNLTCLCWSRTCLCWSRTCLCWSRTCLCWSVTCLCWIATIFCWSFVRYCCAQISGLSFSTIASTAAASSRAKGRCRSMRACALFATTARSSPTWGTSPSARPRSPGRWPLFGARHAAPSSPSSTCRVTCSRSMGSRTGRTPSIRNWSQS